MDKMTVGQARGILRDVPPSKWCWVEGAAKPTLSCSDPRVTQALCLKAGLASAEGIGELRRIKVARYTGDNMHGVYRGQPPDPDYIEIVAKEMQVSGDANLRLLANIGAIFSGMGRYKDSPGRH